MRPLLFNVFISGLFLILNNVAIASYTDHNTPYCYYRNFADVVACLERTADDLFASFNSNEMKANADKCHKRKTKCKLSSYTIMNRDKEKLLVVTIDNHLKFESHIKHLRSKSSQKLYALSSVSLYMNFN